MKALLLLELAPDGGEVPRGAQRVAAHHGHLLEDDDARARLLRGDRGGETGAPRTDHGDVDVIDRPEDAPRPRRNGRGGESQEKRNAPRGGGAAGNVFGGRHGLADGLVGMPEVAAGGRFRAAAGVKIT